MSFQAGANSTARFAGSGALGAIPHTSRLGSFGWLLILVLSAGSMTAEPQPQLLPHHEELGPGVHAAGFSHQFASANCGWVELDGETLLVDLPRGRSVEAYLDRVTAQGKRPARLLVLTHIWEDSSWATYSAYEPVEKRWYRSPEPMGPDAIAPLVGALIKGGVKQIVTSPKIRQRLLGKMPDLNPSMVTALSSPGFVGDSARSIRFLPLDGVWDEGAGALYLLKEKVLFGGPLVMNGIRFHPDGKDTAAWIEVLDRLHDLGAREVVPGFGSWTGTNMLGRLRDLLAEVRDEVAYGIAIGYSLAEVQKYVRIPDGLQYWTTHSRPRDPQIAHVYRELTVPNAPFHGRPPRPGDSGPHALVLIGDSPHPPAPIRKALAMVFQATGVTPHFTVDVNALSAENLSRVQLLVILRDGRQVERKGEGREPLRVLVDPLHGEIKTWVTLEQERAVVDFVEKGGSFLNLHNSLGLYPPAGPYLKLVGGRYIGHGPYERFRVEVVDPDHPITEGVSDYTTADEQHSPVIYDESQVHMILESRMDNGIAVPAGWVREAGKGRVCHLAGGHPAEPLFHPMYQRLMKNAVRWCLRAE